MTIREAENFYKLDKKKQSRIYKIERRKENGKKKFKRKY